MALFEFGVVGGGIVGLACAARLSQFGSVVLFEQHSRVLQETSSRNSGVVHAGIYYPRRSLKTQLCVDGNQNIWRLAERHPESVAARKTGKWIGAVSDAECARLDEIACNMGALGIPFRWLTQSEMHEHEPNVAFTKAICSLNSGIIDVHSLAEFLIGAMKAANPDSVVGLQSQVKRVHQCRGRVRVELHDATDIECQHVVCSMGLHTEEFWKSGGFVNDSGDPIPFDERCALHFCKGTYVGYRETNFVRRLVYPCPLPNLKGLGVHTVVDMQGSLRLGPNAEYTSDRNDLRPSNSDAVINEMYNAARTYLPKIEKEKMFVDFCGMRPKLSGEGESARDFLVENMGGQSNQIVLLAGIESPGLTASTAIADHVASMLLGDTAHKTPPVWR